MENTLLRLITTLVDKGVITVSDLQGVDELIDVDAKQAEKRLPKPRRIQCKDNKGQPCQLIASTRAGAVSIRCEGGDEWAHLTRAQASSLIRWLTEANQPTGE